MFYIAQVTPNPQPSTVDLTLSLALLSAAISGMGWAIAWYMNERARRRAWREEEAAKRRDHIVQQLFSRKLDVYSRLSRECHSTKQIFAHFEAAKLAMRESEPLLERIGSVNAVRSARGLSIISVPPDWDSPRFSQEVRKLAEQAFFHLYDELRQKENSIEELLGLAQFMFQGTGFSEKGAQLTAHIVHFSASMINEVRPEDVTAHTETLITYILELDEILQEDLHSTFNSEQ